MNNRFNINESEKTRIRGLHGIQLINEQKPDFSGGLDSCVIRGQEGNRETCVDYILRHFMHIDTKGIPPANSGGLGWVWNYEYKEVYVDNLTDEEKKLYCYLLSDKFLANWDSVMKADGPFKGDATC